MNTPTSRILSLRAATLAVLLCLTSGFAAAADWIYSTRPGDNIWNLTEQHLKSIGYWQALQRYNGVEDPRRIQPGTRLRIPIRWLKVQPASAEIAVVRGDVRRAPADAAVPVVARVGDRLSAGDGVVTGPDSSATVRFADGSSLLVHAETQVMMDSMSAYGTTGMVDTRMRLDRGRLENRVTPAAGSASRYQIITPSAVVAVRGTEFRAAYGAADGIARSEVTEGSVRVSAGQRRRDVEAGFGLLASADAPLARPVALLPAPDLSGLPGRLERVLVSLSWPALDGAQAYRVQIFRPGTPVALLHEARVAEPGIEFDAPVDGRYLLRIRGIDARALEGLDAERSVEVDARPVAPRRLGPAQGADLLDTESPELWWSRPEGIDRYRLQIAAEGRWDSSVVDRVLDETTRLILDAPLAAGQYLWRLASIAGDGEQGPYGDPGAFRVLAVPAAASASTSVSEDGVTLSWDRLANAATYEFQLARDPDFEDLVDARAVGGLSHPVEGLDAGEYHFRARGISAEGIAGPYSPVNAFEIAGEPVSPTWLLLLAPLLLLL